MAIGASPARSIQTIMTNHFEEGKAQKKRQQSGLPPADWVGVDWAAWSEAAIISWGCYHWSDLPLVSTLQRRSCSQRSHVNHVSWRRPVSGLWEIAQAGQNAWSLSTCAILNWMSIHHPAVISLPRWHRPIYASVTKRWESGSWSVTRLQCGDIMQELESKIWHAMKCNEELLWW